MDLSSQLAGALSDGIKALTGAASALADSLGSVPVPLDSGKRTKAAVRYRSAGEGDGHCSGCTHWNSNGTCELVVGKIDPEAVCDLYKERMVRVKTLRPVDANADNADE